MFPRKRKILTVIILFSIVILYVKFEMIDNGIVDRITNHEKLILRLKAVGELTTISERWSTTVHRKRKYRAWKTSAGNPNIFRMPDIESYSRELNPEKNIFFIISTVIKDNIARLTARQSCAIESAARANADWSVFVLFTSATVYSSIYSSHMAPLLIYPNIHMRRLNLSTFAIGTPLEKFFQDGRLKNSTHIVEHTSDVLRMLTLYKYGGTYLDSDVVVMKSLNELPLNYVASEGDGYIANGVINLQATGYGHMVAEALLTDLAENFNGLVWAANGPELVTRVMRKFCNVTDVWDMTRETCGGQMSVLEPETFFQITYPHHTWYFEEQHTEEAMEKVAGRILTHLWNKLTSGIQLRKDSPVAYIKLAKAYCPFVIKNCAEFF
ncbi:lactosylceramide 4-alpha-galactosyltransferase-like [Armigeres subalbatus]|uniref:lactosylceramide 4-alpha-galactosyltransferase-like n=1 Tax=Armigeres subalbatus TaxID=124917 RepID=UPI002ED600E3